jgi:hypothetical protein
MAATASCIMAKAASGNPNRGRTCRGPPRQGTRPGEVGAEDKSASARRSCRNGRGGRRVSDALLPVLYLRGVSTGDFQEALAALLGKYGHVRGFTR